MNSLFPSSARRGLLKLAAAAGALMLAGTVQAQAPERSRSPPSTRCRSSSSGSRASTRR